MEETLTEAESGGNFAKRIVDLSAYTGETVYVAFVHYDVTDNDMLILNNVAVQLVNSAILFPEIAEFNPLDPEEVTTTLFWYGASAVSEITTGTTTLVAGTDYSVQEVDSESSVLTIFADFLADFEDEDVELTLSFDAGDPVVFTVTITATPDNATVSPEMADFIPTEAQDISTTITWGGATEITSIKAGEEDLAAADYEIDGDQLTIKATYFDDKEPGYVIFSISFDLGEDAVFIGRILDNSVHTLPFSESFMGLPELGGETTEEWLPNGWIAVDADGDDFNWYWVPILDNEEVSFGRMQSRSYYNDPEEGDVALTPDNWLISPLIQLNQITAENQEIELTFQVAPGASTPAFRQENYSVMISYTNREAESFAELFTETISEDHPQNELQERKVELTFYEGQTVYIAFRHHDSSDNDRLLLANVDVIFTGETGIFTPDISFSVYPNPTRDFVRINADVLVRQITLIGITGNVIRKETVDGSRYQLNLSGLSEGTYILKAETENGTVVRRIQLVR